MMPSPPSAITGSVSSSSPESTENSGGRPRDDVGDLRELPDASFTAAMPGIFAISSVVFASMLLPVRPGTL